eukprot:12923783-Prorocentrum_lima.AAC.1
MQPRACMGTIGWSRSERTEDHEGREVRAAGEDLEGSSIRHEQRQRRLFRHAWSGCASTSVAVWRRRR